MRSVRRESRQHSWRLALILFLGLGVLSVPVVYACHCGRKLDRFNRLRAAGLSLRACRTLADMARKHGIDLVNRKFGGGPGGNPAPNFPMGFSPDECEMEIEMADGMAAANGIFGEARLVASGGSGEVGTTKDCQVCLIALDRDENKVWDITIEEIDDPGNCFTVVDTAFNGVGPLTFYDCPCFTVGIAIDVDCTPLQKGTFQARATCRDPGQPVGSGKGVDDVLAQFCVVAVSSTAGGLGSLVICPETPIVKAGSGEMPALTASVMNISNQDVDVNFTVCPPIDPRSQGDFCDGELYDVFDFRIVNFIGFSAPPQTFGTTFPVTIPANSTVSLGAMFAGRRFCEKGMIGCCKFRFEPVGPVTQGNIVSAIDTTQYLAQNDENELGRGADRGSVPVVAVGVASEDGFIGVGAGPISGTVPVKIGMTAKEILDELARRVYENNSFLANNPLVVQGDTHVNGLFNDNVVDLTGTNRKELFLDTQLNQSIWIGRGGAFDDIAITDVRSFDVDSGNIFDVQVDIEITTGMKEPPDFCTVRVSDGNGLSVDECFDTSGLPYDVDTSVITQLVCPPVPGFSVREEGGLCIYTATVTFPALGIAAGTMITVSIDPFNVISIENPAGGQGLSQQAQVGPPPAPGGRGSSSSCGAGSPLAIAVILLLRNFLFRRRRD